MLTHIGKITAEMRKRIIRFDYSQIYPAGDFATYCKEYAESWGESFDIDRDNERVVAAIGQWAVGDRQFLGRADRGIYLAGNTGTGKSWLMEILQAYCREKKMAVKIPGHDNLLPLYVHIFLATDICDQYAKTGSIDNVKRLPILCVQDLGSEPRESQYMGNRLDVMRRLIEYRGEFKDKITLFTSNIPMDKIAERYGDRVASRLADMCTYIVLKGRDRRLNKAI